MQHDNHKSGLWAALFIILLLPFLFLRQGGGSLSLAAPGLGVPASLPRAGVLWDYQGGAEEIPVWLGGDLLGNQAVVVDGPAALVALSAEGKLLWREEVSEGFKTACSGDELLLAVRSGRTTLFRKGGPVWATPSAWPAEALALAPDGRAAVVQGPFLEGSGNLAEQVRLYTPDGSVAGEHLLRNGSVLKIAVAPSGWLISTLSLGSEKTEARLTALNERGERTEEIWRSPEIIQVFAADEGRVAAASGSKVQVTTAVAETRELEVDNAVSHLAWTWEGGLLVCESGSSVAAPSRLTFFSPEGKKVWQRRLRGHCRGLFVRGDTVLVADPNLVYALDLAGKPQWCFEAPLPLKNVLPLAEKNEVLVELEGNRLLLVQPPEAAAQS